MKFKTVYNQVKGVPFISDDNAHLLYNFILKNKPKHILELGIAHGTASCYIAAALDEIGEGKLTCVDLLEVKEAFIPTIETQLSALQLEQYVDIKRMKTGYNWFLHNAIKSASENDSKTCIPKYDLIIIDGPKHWTIDSSSFFLSDKLLKDQGWIIWDDYLWSYNQDGAEQDATDGITHRHLSDEELATPHIKEIFHLLVMQHPNYGNFIIQSEGDWVWAQKTKADTKKIKYTTSSSVTSIVKRVLKRLLKR